MRIRGHGAETNGRLWAACVRACVAPLGCISQIACVVLRAYKKIQWETPREISSAGGFHVLFSRSALIDDITTIYGSLAVEGV